ncbi:MAG: RHS repeat domain-containing protein [Bryobacteraceae bacterium]
MTSRTDARGVTTTYAYDALNRLTGKSYSDGTPTVTYAYDTARHLIQVKNGNAKTNFTSFDAMGNIQASNQVTPGQTYGFTYAYNLAGALTREAYRSGPVITMSRGGADRVASLTGSLNGQSKTYASAVTYWPSGALSCYAAGNSVVPSWTYNSRLQPENEWATIITIQTSTFIGELSTGAEATTTGICKASQATKVGRGRRPRCSRLPPITATTTSTG